MQYQTFTHTIRASATGVQKRFITLAGAQAVADSQVFGVPKTDFVAGQDVAVDYLGVIGVEAGAAIALGAGITPDAQGRAITDPTASNGVAANRVGIATNAVTAAGQTVFVLIR